MRILIVDDKEENRYMLEALLKGNNHGVDLAANGVEALEKLNSGKFELIVSDILMPVMDGFQLCRKVKSDETLRQIPFIIYTATYTGPKDEALAVKIGADRFIQKPCEPDVFMDAVREVVAAVRRDDSPPRQEPAQEEEILKLYNERLVRKLEQKMLQAEQEVRARQDAEKTLSITNVRLQLALAAANIGLWEWDIDTGELWLSTQWKRQIGYDDHEIPGRYEEWEKRLHPEDRNRILSELNAYLQGRHPEYNVEFRLRHRDGRYRWIAASGRTVEGESSGRMMGCHVDITERKRMQEQLIQAQKMESVGRLSGGVAHDFNNMLGVIIGHAELALVTTEPSTPTHAHLVEIQKAAERSAGITRQLLAFARKQTIRPRVLDFNKTVESMLSMLRRLIGEEIDLIWKPGPGGMTVKIDSTQIDQVLANLCVNARDAVSGAGTVTIETDRAVFDEAYCTDHLGFIPGEYVELTVSDSGCGMDKETLENIFEPFFTTKAMGRGTGLGLATVYGIIRQNDGFVNVYSEPGNGTTFKIYLPYHIGQPAEALQTNPTAIPRGRGETVLVVEDEGAIRKMAAEMLGSLGYSVLTADLPSEALRLVRERQTPTDLLLTDVVMPEMTGRDLSERLFSLNPNIKTLYMSGYSVSLIAGRGGLDDGVHFIQKPFSIKELAESVREAMNPVLDTVARSYKD